MIGRTYSKRMFLLLFLLLPIFIGCIDTGPYDFSEIPLIYGPHSKIVLSHNKSHGSFSGDKNGFPFEGDIYYHSHEDYCHGCFSICIRTYQDSFVFREEIVVVNLNVFESEYEIFKDIGTNTNGDGIGFDIRSEAYYDT